MDMESTLKFMTCASALKDIICDIQNDFVDIDRLKECVERYDLKTFTDNLLDESIDAYFEGLLR